MVGDRSTEQDARAARPEIVESCHETPNTKTRQHTTGRIAAAKPTPPKPRNLERSALSREESNRCRVSNLVELPEEVGRPLDVTAAPHQQARIMNPATRGRKAALKAHAAGQVPQSVLPADAAPLRVSAIRAVAPPTNNEAQPAKRKMTFPGFVSAHNNGPWSREAHDLLETGRPSG